VTPQTADLVEFNSSISLSCSSSGPSLSFLWMNSSSEVTTSDRVQITDGGSKLTIINVTRYDNGPYRCHVYNPVSNDSSDPVDLFISYGPENIQVDVSPSKHHYEEGSDIRLICSVESRPSAEYQWFLDGAVLPGTGPELRLVNIHSSQSGNYSCQAFNSKTLRYQTSQPSTVSVLELVSNVEVTAHSPDFVEFNSSVRLSCSSSGSFPSFLWLNSSFEVTTSDRIQISDGGSKLTIINVTRYDNGPYSCHVSNPVSNASSDPVTFLINYGPENLQLNISPPQEHHGEGSEVTLNCAAESRPVAEYLWFLNGDQLPDEGPELRLTDIQMNQRGNYSCQAFNSKTLRYQTSQDSAVSVLARISNVVVVSSSTDLVEFNSSVTLSCSSSGFSPSFSWMNGSSAVTDGDRFQLSNGNSTLKMFNVTRSDQGLLRCQSSNYFSSDSSDPVNLNINYGPENIILTISPNQEHYEEGADVVLSCLANSKPDATFVWFLNENLVADSGSQFNLINMEGNYSCRAFNEKTLRYIKSQISTVSVSGSSSSSGLSAGVIAAIVVVCLVFIAGL
uniref:Ig-like domain-containing protein n=1 Tax=Poecilia formosa TaxID=48698 RepID=A0A096MCD4_POEFO